jgi:hypothetical protein
MRHIGFTRGIAPVHQASASLKPVATLKRSSTPVQGPDRCGVCATRLHTMGDSSYRRPAAGLAALLNLQWRVIHSTDLEKRISRLEQARTQSPTVESRRTAPRLGMMGLVKKVFPKMMPSTARADAVGKSCRSYVEPRFGAAFVPCIRRPSGFRS